jgi:hypothetical protein
LGAGSSWTAAENSSNLGSIISDDRYWQTMSSGQPSAVVGLPGGSMVTGELSARFEIGRTISHSLSVIIAIGVRHLLRSSCHLGFETFIRLIRQGTFPWCATPS